MNTTIQQATTADIPAIAELLTDATAYKVKHGDMAWDDGAWSNEEVADDMSSQAMYVALVENEIIGVFLLQWQDRMWAKINTVRLNDAGYVHRLALKDGYHGHNIGGKLLDWASNLVAQKGRVYLRLDCPATNSKLCAYYEGQGFIRIATKPNPMIEGYTAAYYQRPVLYENNTMDK